MNVSRQVYAMSEGDRKMKGHAFLRRLTAGFLLFLACGLAMPHAATEAVEDDVHLLIHLAERRLYVMLNDTPVFGFPVATGRSTKPTPTGTFRIVTKVVNPYYLPGKIAGGDPKNPLGTRWMGLNIGNGYKYGIHGTHKPHLIGQPVSSGCIRMRNQDVEFLYRHIPLKTTVIITDRKPSAGRADGPKTDKEGQTMDISAQKEKVTAVRKNGDGDIVELKLSSGQTVDYKTAQAMAKAGQIEGVHVFKGRDGEDHLRSNPDGIEENNLDNLPQF